MKKPYFDKPLRLNRTAQEYAIPSVWMFLGFINLIPYIFLDKQMKYPIVSIAPGFLIILVSVVYITYKVLVPIMSSDGRTIVIFPGIFTRRTIEPREVKTVRIFKYIGVKKVRFKPIRQLSTILIELNDGNVLTLKNIWLVDSVREKLASFLQNFDITLEVTDIA